MFLILSDETCSIAAPTEAVTPKVTAYTTYYTSAVTNGEVTSQKESSTMSTFSALQCHCEKESLLPSSTGINS